MGIQTRVPMKVEVAVPAYGLPKQATIPEVDPTAKAYPFTGSSFPDHPCGKLVQKSGRRFQPVLWQGSEDLLQNLGRSSFVLGQESSTIRRQG